MRKIVHILWQKTNLQICHVHPVHHSILGGYQIIQCGLNPEQNTDTTGDDQKKRNDPTPDVKQIPENQ